MFSTGDMLMHPSAGICRVEEIRTICFGSQGDKDYYVLKPLHGGSAVTTTIYLPLDYERIHVSRVLTREDILKLIASVAERESVWVEDHHKRKEIFADILHSGDRAELIKLIIELSSRKRAKESQGKKLRQSDAKALADAERLICEEFSYALGLKPDEVADFVISHLPQEKEQSVS